MPGYLNTTTASSRAIVGRPWMLVLLAMLAACHDNQAPLPTPVATVTIAPVNDLWMVGESRSLTAVARTASGTVLEDRTIAWSSEDAAIAQVFPDGTVLARGEGMTGVRATSEGKSDRIVLRVVTPAPVPSVWSLLPRELSTASPTPLTLQIIGTGFVAASVATWNGTARATQFMSPTELRMTVTPNDVANVGEAHVAVTTPAPGGGASAPVALPIVDGSLPQPTISTLAPHRIVVGWTGPFTVVITGTGFSERTRLSLDGQPWQVMGVNANTISFRLTPADVATARNITIQLTNPAPGGGVASATFTVEPLAVASVEIGFPYGAPWTWAGLGVPLNATALSATGVTLTDRVAAWHSHAPQVATVVPTGPRSVRVYGAQRGVARIAATIDQVTSHIDVQVYDTPTHDIVFGGGQAGDRYIALWSLPTGNLAQRIPVGVQAMQPAPSPDGQWIAFTSIDDETATTDIFVARRNGSDRRRLTADAASDGNPTWSPDGQRLAWASSRANGTLDIWTMNADGSDARQLTTSRLVNPLPGSGQVATQPAWSPDGRRLVYAVGLNGRSHLWVMNADGSGKRQLTRHEIADDYEPTWSPDGRVILFRRTLRTPAVTTQFRVDAETGAEIVNLFVSVIEAAETPAWSPDGTWILTSSGVAGSDRSLVAIHANALERGLRIVLPASPGGVRNARWIRRP